MTKKKLYSSHRLVEIYDSKFIYMSSMIMYVILSSISLMSHFIYYV